MKIKQQAGFSLIDVMIAIVILTVGILALLAALSGAVVQSKGQEKQLNAKQIAGSTIESIMSVKETDRQGRLGWKAIGNIGNNPNGNGGFTGVFVNGFQPVKTDAGADEIIGTVDDSGAIQDQYQRQIVITDRCDPDRPSPVICNPAGNFAVRIRSVQVTIRYFVGSAQRQEVVTTVLTDYDSTSN